MRTQLYLLTLAAALLARPAQAQRFHTITDLGTLGGRESRAYAISSNGWVAGEAATSGGETHAFLWKPDGGMIDLGTLGGPASRAYDLAEDGTVVGESDVTSGLRRAFRWREDKGMTALPAVTGSLDSCAYAVNSRGVVAGTIDDAEGNRAYLWKDAASEPVAITATGGVGIAYDINRDGTVAGHGEIGETQFRTSHAFVFDPNGFARALADTGPGIESAAYAINDRGQIAGHVETGYNTTHAFLYDAGGLRNIDTLNNVFSAAYGLNNQGEVVGSCFNGPADDDQAFLYTGGSMYNLNDLLDSDSDWVLIEAWDINDAGQIVGRGVHDGQERAFLLTPIASNGNGAMPAIRITSPAANTAYAEPAVITIKAEARGEPGIRRVIFYANGTVVGSVTEPPYVYEWKDAAAGDWDLVARAIDNKSQSGSSGRVRVHVNLPPNDPPSVEIVRPAPDSILAPGSNLVITAKGSDGDGSVARMEVHVNGELIASDNTDIIGAAWVAPTNGVYWMSAVAEDDRGTRTTSDITRVSVASPAGTEISTP